MRTSWLAAISLVACTLPTFSGVASAATTGSIDRVVAPALATDDVEFALHFPLRNEAELDALIVSQTTPGSPFYHRFLTPEQFRASYAPEAAVMSKALAALQASGIAASRSSSQALSAHGPAAIVERFFNTKLARFGNRASMHLAAVAPLTLPAGIADSGAVVVNLSKRYQLRPQVRVRPQAPQNRDSPFGAYYFDDLKQAYVAPSYQTVNGKGVNVAIVGDGDFSDADLRMYFGHELVGSASYDLAPLPKTVHHRFPGAPPYGAQDYIEASLDVQQVAGIAPGATTTVFVTKDASDAAFIDAYQAIVESNRYDVVSTSYGLAECFYTAAYNGGVDYTGVLRAYADVFKQGNAQGITFVTSSGDNAGLACPELGYFLNPPTTPAKMYKNVPGINGLSASPNVTSVGGGNLQTTYRPGTLNSAYVAENGVADYEGPSDPYGTGNLLSNSYFGAGGGESLIFAKPTYQKLVDTHTQMRANPDVGGHVGGTSATGSYDYVNFDGRRHGVIGTSASAPDFAGLVALAVQRHGARLGNVNNNIYAEARNNQVVPGGYFHDSIPTFNGVVSTPAGRHGYNFVYGVGSPIYKNAILLPNATPAGVPQTRLNP